MRFVIAALLFVLAVVPAAAQDGTATPPPVHERCIAATSLPNVAELVAYPDRPENEQLIADIEGGLHDGITLSHVWVVKSDDFANVWFVAGQLESDVIEFEDSDVGVWAVGSITEDGEYTGVGLIYAVGGYAVEFSNWGDGGRTEAQLSINDDGAEEAMECAEGKE